MNILPDIKKILYCMRIGPNSAYIYRYALALAEKFDATITVMHAREALSKEKEALINGYIGPDSIHDIMEQEEQDSAARIKEHLKSFCARIGKESNCGNRVEKILIVEGASPAREIIKQAGDMEADIIIMGAHAESSILEKLMGSTTEKVIRRSSIPVLVVQVPVGEQEFTASGI
ncbi:MAG: universal stress protein [Desulfobulbaceae bacterium]|nr:universal stress protein [Desulfobulbaceae bacterium]